MCVLLRLLLSINLKTWDLHHDPGNINDVSQRGVGSRTTCRGAVTNLENFDLGEVSGVPEIRGVKSGIKAVAHDAHRLIFSSCPRAAEVLEASD